MSAAPSSGDADAVRDAGTKALLAALTTGYGKPSSSGVAPAVHAVEQAGSSSGSQSKLLYSPSNIGVAPVAQTGPPANLAAFPKLLSADVEPSFEGHKSHEIASALAKHHDDMQKLEAELKKLGQDGDLHKGHHSKELADALIAWRHKHPNLKVADFEPEKGLNQFLAGSAGAAGGAVAMKAVDAPASFAVDGVTTTMSFSWAAQLKALQWARVIYCITWIVGGLFLLFFGFASLYWLSRKGKKAATPLTPATAALPGLRGSKGKKSKGGKGRSAPLAGGVGGLLIGFFSFSTLASLINAAVSIANPARTTSPGAYFAVWLVPGLLGAAFCGHFKFAARLFSGLLGACNLTIILTAMFGIHTLLIRAILISILAVLLSAPLLLPRSALLQRHLLNFNTSLIGSVIFLNGVALFAPPQDSMEGWLNLLVVLFAPDGSDALNAAVDSWGTSAFKGMIAGSVLATVVGFLFEALLHSHSGEDAEASWNDYLGAYTERYEKSGMLPGQYEGSLARQGLFEPAPTPWQRLAAVFAEAGSARSGPASYGNIPGGQNVEERDADADTLTAIPSRKRSRGASSRKTHKSGKTSRGVPARFSALSRRDHDLDLENGDESGSEVEDSDVTDVEEDAGDVSKGGALDTKSRLSSTSKGPATSEQLSALARSTYALPSPLPRPPGSLGVTSTPLPSYRSDATASTGVGSNMSGSTKVSSVSTAHDGAPHKAFENYRDSGSTPTPAVASSTSRPTSPLGSAPIASAGNAVQATPSLINAISRIQAAQAQARAWQAAQAYNNNSPYGNQAADVNAPLQSPTSTPASPPLASPRSPRAEEQRDAFGKWWREEVSKK